MEDRNDTPPTFRRRTLIVLGAATSTAALAAADPALGIVIVAAVAGLAAAVVYQLAAAAESPPCVTHARDNADSLRAMAERGFHELGEYLARHAAFAAYLEARAAPVADHTTRASARPRAPGST